MTRRTRVHIQFVWGVVLAASAATAQQPATPPPPVKLINVPENPLLSGFRWRSIGPVGQGGRVDDIAVDEKNPSTFYIGFAVGVICGMRS